MIVDIKAIEECADSMSIEEREAAIHAIHESYNEKMTDRESRERLQKEIDRYYTKLYRSGIGVD